MTQDIEAFTATLLARRPDRASQENAALLSDISAAFRDYGERLGPPQPARTAHCPAALVAGRRDHAAHENAALLSGISAAFRDYVERLGPSQQVDTAQNADGH